MARNSQGPRLATNAQGLWEIRWSERGRSRRKSTGCRDRTAAEQVFAHWLQRSPAAGGPLTVTQALHHYLEGHVRARVADVRRTEVMAGWLEAGLGPRQVAQLGDLDIQRYIRQRETGAVGTGPAGAGTIRLELGTLRAALNYAAQERLLDATQLPRIRMPAKPAGKAKWLTEEQVDCLLGALTGEDAHRRMTRAHRFVVLALATGARREAIETLTWAQVEWHTGLIRYDQHTRAGSRKRRTAAPVPDWLTPYLERMAREANTGYVLDHPGSIRSGFEWAMKRCAQATGEPAFRQLDRHALRHTCATLMLRAGASIWQVAGVLGDSPETVAQTYGHHAQDHLREAVNSWRRSG